MNFPPRCLFVLLSLQRLCAAGLSALCLWLPVFYLSSTQAADVQGLRLYRAPDNTRLVFDLSGEVDHQLQLLPKQAGQPERLLIVISNTAANVKIGELELKGTTISQLQLSRVNDFDLQVVLDLSADVAAKSFMLKPNAPYGYRLVIDLADVVPLPLPVTPPPLAQNASKPDVSYPGVARQGRDILIMIDAGHGGEDPGAMGPGRVREKDITLRIAKALEAQVNQQKGYRAELTRKGDYYVDLRKRSKMARDKNADLFVSIHADAFKNPKAAGASVFAWSQRGATSETARFLADKENLSDLVGGADPNSVDDTLVQVLADLQLDGTVRLSLGMGAYVLREVDTVARLHKQHVEQAGFMVLKSVNVPSLLVETGFISNPDEARKLNSPAYQQQMANAIFTGINKHFTKIPPPGSYLASLRGDSPSPTSTLSFVAEANADEAIAPEVNPPKANPPPVKPVTRSTVKPKAAAPRVHVVRRGDSLTDIAGRYGISVSTLKKYNKLSKSKIFVGQKLKIPHR